MNELLTYEESVAMAIYSINASDLYTALKICKSADSIEHVDQRLNFMHAAILNQLGLYKDSIELYEKVLAEDSGNELARFHLGSACFFSGDIKKAREEWDSEGYFGAAIEAFYLINDEQFDEAIAKFSQFIQSNKNYPELNPDLERFSLMLEDKLDNIKAIEKNEKEEKLERDISTEEVMDDSTVDALLSIYKKN
ncbi:tetratricopeptide repeat protein [Vibrio vulnificus]|nr:hypothetical protein [Vibrio vulnificus]ELX4197066.1 hypothetical protein [Vibrio vulnificus]